MGAFDIIFNQIKDLKAKKQRMEDTNIASLEKANAEIKQMMKETK